MLVPRVDALKLGMVEGQPDGFEGVPFSLLVALCLLSFW